ncbi:molecular chaperone (small heat shock protein) [Thioflavicoccus mobilis 8321]|uniref:Molecular chaperone (Small heat shock protein) n=1 Tax=Thioflavicoccus mobilis 8321 TaxID=765912 RepID=L0H205_9GAMM|nr:Hsp20/alpha crystallin family protein [Thioflavicoccus mobilis]AGA92271.1 molecular chaperone (small heat shock protein) [Thioflavicoccus mobilis 8321]
MSTMQQIRRDIGHAWDALFEGWQRLYHRATGAITRFTHGAKDAAQASAAEVREMAERSAGWGVLAAEVFDDDDKVVVRLEAPGMGKDDFDLQVMDDYLVVRGEKRLGREETVGRYHITECAYGRFERAIPLPEEVDSEQAGAVYRDGVLRVELPKTTSRRRAIKVDVQ